MAPRFSATGMLSAARCMRVLSITQHAWRPITFRMNENNKPVYDFCAVGSCYQYQAAVIGTTSYFFPVNI
jgi:hypothetical protein